MNELYSAYVTIYSRGKDPLIRTVYIVVKGNDEEKVKMSYDSLKRALKYCGLSKGQTEDINKWYIKEVVIDKKLGL